MLTSVFISAEDTTSQSENRKKSAKKDFEIDFDDDIDFHVYFRKTKVCAGFFCLFVLLLGPHLWHVEVPRLGGESELQLPAYTTASAT